MEVVFARGTVTPEQQKKVPLTQTQDEEKRVDGDYIMLSVTLHLQYVSYIVCRIILVSNGFVSRGHSFEVQV